MTNLRQIANHPLQKFDDREPNSDPEAVVNLSGKMMLLDRLLPELFKRKHKVRQCPFFRASASLMDSRRGCTGLDLFPIYLDAGPARRLS